jgi:D-xylono/L-arabinono-1,4-lactonase
MNLPIRAISNQHCDTGENPYWHPTRRCVYWTDIPAGVLYCWDPAVDRVETVYRGDPVGGFTLQSDGNLLLFRVRDVAVFDVATRQVRVVVQYTDDTMQRFNDVHADPIGRVFAGTIGTADDNGGLYLLDLDLSMRKIDTGSRVANGMAFSLDETTFFWTDTGSRQIFAYDFHRDDGSIRNKRVHYKARDDEGWPDGLAMDRDEHIWSTRWDGGRIVIINRDGKKVDELTMPVPKVSCCFFGGETGSDLFITTAGGKPDGNTADGTLYVATTKTTGRPRFVSRIGI